jgi:hypothetical protein
MEPETILQNLTYNIGRFPRGAVRAAVARREEITPHLLSIIEDATADLAEP